MTDRREGFPPTPASSSTPLHDGGSEALSTRFLESDEAVMEQAERELVKLLVDAGVKFTRLGGDPYDWSVELYEVPADDRLSEIAQRILHDAGFLKAYVNHQDKWETHYNFKPSDPFCAVAGWRVSYPHKRGGDERGIWVEEFPKSWPRKWLGSGYVVKKAKDSESPSYQRSSEGTRSGGQQTPTQNEGE